ncbi:asparagine synthase-related protein [Micromonospora sp. WMMC241]|uniref:asparagine synthase-related protein n=1 Tax=Micromonospora sp. WMMC241 TaxID=3015159 RepID=UPI0022B69D45|nr:asparagine synthase-related protein [Micromonospora sp. WMMC241]MCZ7440056.1 asparagine synthase-related protein [Micromonospora sp. WMMC241]
MLRPTPRDIAAGLVIGQLPPVPPSPARRPVPDPLTALEAAVLPALRRSPCVLSFSGGLDSSLVLAVAVRVARREGLPDPIPVTWRFTDAPRAEESPWQERVIRAMGVSDWQILRADDDLDLVGPVARRLLHHHGLLAPANQHLHLPVVELAAGGSMLTGVGGDQILAGWRRPLVTRLRGRLGRLRHRALGRYTPQPQLAWLRPQAAAQIRRATREWHRAEPHRLHDRMEFHMRSRSRLLNLSSLAAIGADHDVLPVHPLFDEGFQAALAARHGHRRDPTRQSLLAAISGDALPPEITAPRRKASFNDVFLRTPTREFVRGWDGTGVDANLVDPDRLRAVWSGERIPWRTALLVQHLWLRANPPGPASVVPPARTTDDREVTT